MFGRQQRKHVEALEEIHEELVAADVRARTVLNDAIAQIDGRLARDREDRERAQLSTEAAVENARSLINAQATDLGHLMEQVANTCALVVQRLEDDRSDRRALAEAIDRLAQLPAAPVDAREHALGGTIFAASEIADHSEPPQVNMNEIDLRDPSAIEHRWTYGEPTSEILDPRPHGNT